MNKNNDIHFHSETPQIHCLVTTSFVICIHNMHNCKATPCFRWCIRTALFFYIRVNTSQNQYSYTWTHIWQRSNWARRNAHGLINSHSMLTWNILSVNSFQEYWSLMPITLHKSQHIHSITRIKTIPPQTWRRY
jgi:hypothetical protein